MYTWATLQGPGRGGGLGTGVPPFPVEKYVSKILRKDVASIDWHSWI